MHVVLANTLFLFLLFLNHLGFNLFANLAPHGLPSDTESDLRLVIENFDGPVVVQVNVAMNLRPDNQLIHDRLEQVQVPLGDEQFKYLLLVLLIQLPFATEHLLRLHHDVLISFNFILNELLTAHVDGASTRRRIPDQVKERSLSGLFSVLRLSLLEDGLRSILVAQSEVHLLCFLYN